MMKKIMLIFILLVVFMVVSTVTVKASNETAELKLSSSIVKPGETFTLKLSATCSDGINGIYTKIIYDEDKLEFIEGEVADSNLISLGAGTEITVISNSNSKITTADIYVLKFKVKSDVSTGSIANISTEEIGIDSDAATNSETKIDSKSVSVKIENNETDIIEQDDNKDITIESQKTEDSTKAKTVLPKTGVDVYLGILLTVVAIVLIIMYRKMKKYRGIKLK